jgi:hypothetical protein
MMMMTSNPQIGDYGYHFHTISSMRIYMGYPRGTEDNLWISAIGITLA